MPIRSMGSLGGSWPRMNAQVCLCWECSRPKGWRAVCVPVGRSATAPICCAAALADQLAARFSERHTRAEVRQGAGTVLVQKPEDLSLLWNGEPG